MNALSRPVVQRHPRSAPSSPPPPRLPAVLAAAALLVLAAAACGGGAWNHVIVPTETGASAECVSDCLAKSPSSRYKCYTRCPGSRIAKATSCDEALSSLRSDGWSYGGSYQCESDR